MEDYLKRIFKYLLRLCVLTVLILLIIEGALRLFGFPKGFFNFAVPGRKGLYPENSTIKMVWGPFPYTIKTNSLGFRGNEIPLKKQENIIRIAGLGDSITDGFFVDNEATYLALLEELLTQEGDLVEVINAARGGASIDKEYAILQELIVPLCPDIVLLTFVTNDIAEIRGKSREGLLSKITLHSQDNLGVSLWLLTQTATLEVLADLFLRFQSEAYRAAEKDIGKQERYEIEGGNRYIENLIRFNGMCRDSDGIILNEPFSEEVKILIENYLFMLRELNSLCQEHNIKLVFIYFPAYSQVYDITTSLKIRDILRTACKEISIPFLDLTETFRQKGKERVLHLAPIDYHLNPAGNKVMAEAIAQFLLKRNFLGGSTGKNN